MKTKILGLVIITLLFSCKEETIEKTNNLLHQTSKGTAFGLKAPKIDNVRVGIIGAGNRGKH
jgi:hypothetical protein